MGVTLVVGNWRAQPTACAIKAISSRAEIQKLDRPIVAVDVGTLPPRTKHDALTPSVIRTREISMLARVLEKDLDPGCSKWSRCKARENGRAQAYFFRTSSEAVGAQRSRWAVQQPVALDRKDDITY